MKQLIIILITLISAVSFSQDKEEAQALALQKANNYVYEGNQLIDSDDYVTAEMEYRKAISEQPTTVSGTYNLGTSYYKKGSYDEALYRLTQAAKNATDKDEKHKAFHNIGNILMQNKKCKEAVEAYKNALRNDPSDEETRYNLVVAKECAEQQQDKEKDQDKKDDENKEDQDKKDDQDQKDEDKKDQDDKKDEGDKDKKEGDDKEDEDGKPKDEKKEDKKDQGKGDEDKKDQAQPKPQPGQMSQQQMQNLLKAMNNQEQKVQEKMNAQKQKGVKVKTEKDW
ncbi:tetratricopeptide repeat protein [Lacinutrix undariae]